MFLPFLRAELLYKIPFIIKKIFKTDDFKCIHYIGGGTLFVYFRVECAKSQISFVFFVQETEIDYLQKSFSLQGGTILMDVYSIFK